MSDREPTNCPECGVRPGQCHEAGCDVERCARCGGQAIACPCVYEVCGMDYDRMEQDHPDVYQNGPTEAMYATWDRQWGGRRVPWSGLWPGIAECREYGLYTRAGREDLNRLAIVSRWDVDRQRYVLPVHDHNAPSRP
jgi:hypothetical protein